MFRSHCPSVVSKRSSAASDENDVSRNSGRKRKKRFNLTETEENEEIGEDGDDLSKTLTMEIRKSTGSETAPTVAANFELGSLRAAHEAFIVGLLNKPFKIPLSGYAATFPALGMTGGRRRRRAMYDIDDPHALILYTPPEMSEMARLVSGLTFLVI